MKPPSCALLISTYNRPAALRRCLDSLLCQSRLPDELLIADDGSDEETRNCITDFNKQLHQRSQSTTCHHVWQQHEGFRVARIRNKALQKTHAKYIVQIDGDMVMHPHFIADHLYLAEVGYYVRGNKYLLNEEQTLAIEQDGIDYLQTMKVPCSRSSKGRRITLLRNLFHLLKFDIKGVFGSNMAYWRQDALAINGYDNRFQGWGSEDDDFADRLRLKGVRCKSVRFGAVAYHLHHPPADRSRVQINNELRTTQHSAQTPRPADGYEQS